MSDGTTYIPDGLRKKTVGAKQKYTEGTEIETDDNFLTFEDTGLIVKTPVIYSLQVGPKLSIHCYAMNLSTDLFGFQ